MRLLTVALLPEFPEGKADVAVAHDSKMREQAQATAHALTDVRRSQDIELAADACAETGVAPVATMATWFTAF